MYMNYVAMIISINSIHLFKCLQHTCSTYRNEQMMFFLWNIKSLIKYDKSFFQNLE